MRFLYNNKLFVRWIHCWETRNFQKPNLFMGIELLFIDSKVFLQIQINLIYNFIVNIHTNSFMIKPFQLITIQDFKRLSRNTSFLAESGIGSCWFSIVFGLLTGLGWSYCKYNLSWFSIYYV